MRDLVELVLATACAGCERPGVRWCPSCADQLGVGPTRRLAVPDGELVVLTAGSFEGAVSTALTAWKDRDRWDLDGPLARALGPVVAAADPGRRAALVPVPSSPAARRRRGRAPLVDLSRAVRPRRTVLPALVAARPLADQSRLSSHEREQNLAGALRVGTGWRRAVRDRAVLLVDDVVTTGATLREAARAVRAAGGTVVGAACVAATPRRHGP